MKPRCPRPIADLVCRWAFVAAIVVLAVSITAGVIGTDAAHGSEATGQSSGPGHPHGLPQSGALRHAGNPQQAEPTATDTFEPWEPSGTWSLWHGPKRDPLWTRDAPDLHGVHGVWDGEKWIGWAVGAEGGMASFDGTQWRIVKDFEPRRTQPLTYTFNDVFVIAPDDVWVVGKVEGDRYCDGCGTMLHYDGSRWHELERISYGVNGRVGAFNAIDMLQDDDGEWYGWIVGDDASFDRFKAVIIGYQPDEGWKIWAAHNIAKHLYDVSLVSPSEAWAVGQDGVESRYNEDRGEGMWPPLGRSGADTLYAVDLNDKLDGWDGGFRGRMNKYRGSCHDSDPATTCWFQNEAIPLHGPTGSLWAITIRAIELQARNQGWLVGDVNGRTSTVAYMSGARDWSVVPVEEDPGRSLNGLYMDSPATWGVAVGDEGTIIQYRGGEAPTTTPTTAPTMSPTSTASATPWPSATSDATATSTPAPSLTSEPTRTVGPSRTPWASATMTPTAAVSATPDSTSPPDEPTLTPAPGQRVYLPMLTRGF